MKLAIEISNKHNGADSVQTAVLTVRHASILAKKGDFASAEPLYKKGVGLLMKNEDFPKEDLADMLQLYSTCLEQLKRPEEAAALATRASELKKPGLLVKP